MFFETGKKYIKLFYEITDKNLLCILYGHVADAVLLKKQIYRFGLSWLVFEIQTIWWTSVFVNMSSNSSSRNNIFVELTPRN